MKISSVYNSLQGIGRNTGRLTSFVRTQLCPLQCTWCDVSYTWRESTGDWEEMSLQSLLDAVMTLPIKEHVCITGGEPVIYQKQLWDFCRMLYATERVKVIEIDTSGYADVRPAMQASGIVRLLMDYKLPSSGMEERMIEKNVYRLRKQDDLIFVVQDDQDLLRARELITGREEIKSQIWFIPVYKKMSVYMLYSKMQKLKLLDQNNIFVGNRIDKELEIGEGKDGDGKTDSA